MTEVDGDFIKRIIHEGQIFSPVLELGVGYDGITCRELIKASNLEYYGTDIENAPNVDFIADFERTDTLEVFMRVKPFGTVLVLNVLEHSFDPIQILDNALNLLKPGGSLVIITPAIWSLHNYPIDVWRIMPNFYEEYASRRNLKMLDEYFEYIGIGQISNYCNSDRTYSFPNPCANQYHYWYSRIIHKVFNTFGRGMSYPSHIAIGAVLVKPA